MNTFECAMVGASLSKVPNLPEVAAMRRMRETVNSLGAGLRGFMDQTEEKERFVQELVEAVAR